MSRTSALPFLALLCGLVACGGSAEREAASATLVRVYKTPTCGCCNEWIGHLEQNGFRVEATDVRDLAAVKRRHGVPPDAEACHTALVDGYVVEGHVPAADVARLLRERPDALGLAVPGMPLGSPGMESETPEPYTVHVFDEAGLGAVFARHEPLPGHLRNP